MDSYLLEPSGPDGCRVVAKETSFLFAGSGCHDGGTARGVVLWQSSWTADDGVTPLAYDDYRLTWSDDGAMLELVGDGVSPVWPSTHSLSC